MSEPDHEAPANEAPATDDPRVDEALRALDDLDAAPVDEHADRLTTAHAALQEVLRDPLAEQTQPGPPRPGPPRPGP